MHLFGLKSTHAEKVINLVRPYQLIGIAVLIILLNAVLALILDKTFWLKNTAIVHTGLELVCVLIAFSIFLVGWETFRFNLPISQLFGFGFLIVAICDIFHTYFFPPLNLYPASITDLGTRFWIFGRLAEGAVTLILSYKLFRKNVNRRIGLEISIGVALIIGYLLSTIPNLLPPLIVQNAVTPTKVALEYVVILLFAISLFNLRLEINERGVIIYKYLFLAAILAIAAELSFTLFRSITSFYNIFGHTLKISCYLFYWKGIFASAITYPFTELGKHDAKISKVLNELPSGLTFYNRDFQLLFANRRALEMFDCDPEELMGVQIEEIRDKYFWSTDDQDKILIQEMVERHLPSKQKVQIFTNRKGEKYWLQAEAHQVDNGEFMYILKDATSEQILENLQLQTEIILNAVTNKVVMWDVNNRILMGNKAFANWFGVEIEDLQGLEWQEFSKMTQFSKPDLHTEIRKSDSKDLKYEVSLILPDGDKKYLLLNTAPIFNVEKQLIGFIDVFNDISDLKQEQQKRIQQEKLALIGQLGAGVVHECKNFLATVKGNSQLLKLTVKDEKVGKYAERIDHATEEINRILSDLLALAKPRIPVMTNVSPRSVVLAMENILRSSSFLHNIDVQIVSREDRPIICDESQLRHVIFNMCKNAAEAMAGVSDPVLRIVTGWNRETDWVYIEITDNGKGIPDDVLTKLGTPFFTTKETGTGLGLSICYHIVEENGGKIDIATEEGVGTTFTISFPAKESNENGTMIHASGQ